ncbi:MAG: hypothetical protein KC517_06665 [Bacteroidetes bacterium]|jgi:hypothetical protein|nr:hypothetical protein [Bacteroidota bacterium]
MKKKLVFIACVLFCSLAVVQYVAMDKVFDEKPLVSQSIPDDVLKIEPVKTEVYSVGDYVVVKKDGKFFVYEKKPKSI